MVLFRTEVVLRDQLAGGNNVLRSLLKRSAYREWFRCPEGSVDPPVTEGATALPPRLPTRPQSSI